MLSAAASLNSLTNQMSVSQVTSGKKKTKVIHQTLQKAEMLVPNIWTDDGTTRKITQGQKKNEKVININKNKL